MEQPPWPEGARPPGAPGWRDDAAAYLRSLVPPAAVREDLWGARALALDKRAKEAHPDALASLPHSRRGAHHLDLARAWLWGGDCHRAFTELESAERVAPQLIRNHPIARATLRRITYAERAATKDPLRRMANRFQMHAH